MSDYFDDEDENGSENGSTNLVKDLRKALKEANKKAEEAERKAAELASSVRQRTVEEVLTSKGVNKKVAALIPSSVEGEEAVSQWLEEFSDVFGIKSDTDDTTPAGMTPDEVAALQKSQGLTDTPYSASKQEEIQRALKAANTREEIDAVIKQYSG